MNQHAPSHNDHQSQLEINAAATETFSEKARLLFFRQEYRHFRFSQVACTRQTAAWHL